MEKRKNSFMNNVAAILGSQFLIKILGLVYNLVIINIPGFGDIGNGYRTAGFQFYTMLLAISSVCRIYRYRQGSASLQARA